MCNETITGLSSDDTTNEPSHPLKATENKAPVENQKILGLLTDVTKNNMIKIKSNDEKLTIPFDSVYECRIIPQI